MIPFVCRLRICFQIAQKAVAAPLLMLSPLVHANACTMLQCSLHPTATSALVFSSSCLSKKRRCTGLQVTKVGFSEQHTIYYEELAGIFNGL
jgi:hypothetical protein